MAVTGARIDQIKAPLERAAAQVLYRSPAQHNKRRLAAVMLCLKHGLRGLVFTWPLYLLGLVGLYSPGIKGIALMVLFLPGVLLSASILYRGVKEDCLNKVEGILLNRGYLGSLMLSKRQ